MPNIEHRTREPEPCGYGSGQASNMEKPLVVLITVLCSGWSVLLAASEDVPSGKDILEKVDANLSSSNRVFTSKMIVHGRRASRTVESKTWATGETKAFTEYLAPARERGTKMLKLEDRLWMYAPSTDRTIQISGHMLRQSVMGSDLSYEDMMEDPRLAESYDAEVTGTNSVLGRDCWELTLTGRRKDLAYPTRKLWVDRERSVPLKEELFAKIGKLLKKTELKDVARIDGRWYPRHIYFKDMLKTGKGTEFHVDTIEFDVEIPARVFSKASLKR